MGMATIVLDEKPEEKELKSFVENNTGRTGRAGWNSNATQVAPTHTQIITFSGF